MFSFAGKLIDACANIGGSCLEQTTWLRRNLAVNSELQATSTSLTNGDAAGHEKKRSEDKDKDNSKTGQTQYAVPALTLLGEMLAPFLDIVYQSDEKEKVLPLLNSVMYNVMPYLRNHSRSNLPSFRACSRLLSSLSEYQYTRKAWKRESVELLLDPAFFQMDQEGLHNWRQTVDNLMTHDKTTFKELMSKRMLYSFIHVSCNYWFRSSQSFVNLPIWFPESVLKQGAGVGTEIAPPQAIGIRHFLLRDGPVPQADARHSR